MNESMNISRRDALKTIGAACLTAAIATTPFASCVAKNEEDKKERTKRLIFFFSATGNSLYVSRQIGGENATILSIPQEIHKEHPEYDAEEIGFVFPTYCFTAPAIVQEFIEQSSFKADYFFAVATYGAHTTRLPEIFGDFARKNGMEMNYISSVQMVDTYLPFFDQAAEQAMDKHTPEQIAKVVEEINARTNYIQPVTEEDKQFYEGYYQFSGRDRVKPAKTRSEKILYSTEDCIGCGICTSVCPHGSWKIVDGKSIANGECENCLACAQNCPLKAISIIRTPPEPEQEANRNARYRNPNVKLIDIIKANSQENNANINA